MLLFFQKILKDSIPEINRFKPVLDEFLKHIQHLPDEPFFLFIKSYYRIERLAEDYLNAMNGSPGGYESINLLSIKYFKYTYEYWLSETDPLEWFKKEAGETDFSEEVENIFTDISIKHIQSLYDRMKEIADFMEVDSLEMLRNLIGLTGYGQLVEAYRKVPQKLVDRLGRFDRVQRVPVRRAHH